MSFRYYIEKDDGTWFRMPAAMSRVLHTGDPLLPQFANSRRRVISVQIATVGRQPDRLVSADGSYFVFTAEGGSSWGRMEAASACIQASERIARANRMKAPCLTMIRKAKEVIASYRWEPTEDEITAICDDIWPGGWVKRAG